MIATIYEWREWNGETISIEVDAELLHNIVELQKEELEDLIFKQRYMEAIPLIHNIMVLEEKLNEVLDGKEELLQHQ